MYVKFKKDGTFKGKSFKKDQVAYLTKAQTFIEEGYAEEIDYEKYHKETVQNTASVSAPKPKPGNQP
jgi:hypothetical protein